MKKQKILFVILLLLVLAHLYCAIFGIGYRHSTKPIGDVGKLYSVKSIRLNDDGTFEVTSFNSRSIVGKIPGAIKSGAKNKVINMLNKAQKPRFWVVGKAGENILIDFIFILDGNETKFSDWLQSNRLWLTTTI